MKIISNIKVTILDPVNILVVFDDVLYKFCSS